jgi:sterol desaturase/sphingolipid hydroxylase (fatty acid hydroxylase superfamily)
MPSNVEALRRRPNAVLHRNGKETPRTDDESSSSWSIESEAPSHAAQSKQRTPSVSGDSTARAALEHQSPFVSESKIAQHFLRWIGLAVWPVMLFLPLLLNHTSNCHYSNLFPRAWYTIHGESWLDKSIEEGGIWEWGTNIMCGSSDKPLRHPLGLSLGISAVAIGHVFLLVYFRLHQQQLLGKTTPVQRRGAVEYVYFAALKSHLSQPGGFLLLGLYLTITWVFDMLPPSYYSFGGGVQYTRVLLCLICQDFAQYVMHRVEHVAHPKVYKISHKPHHRFTNPKLFDAFDGSVPDTAIMILIPLFITAHVVRDCNVWTYMAFGSSYANWLTFIHSETTFPWEPLFRSLGLGTAADHHVHHKFFKYNFGHTFMWFDWIAGTYRNPKDVWGKEFNVGV